MRRPASPVFPCTDLEVLLAAEAAAALSADVVAWGVRGRAPLLLRLLRLLLLLLLLLWRLLLRVVGRCGAVVRRPRLRLQTGTGCRQTDTHVTPQDNRPEHGI